jgi:hypothetical protein
LWRGTTLRQTSAAPGDLVEFHAGDGIDKWVHDDLAVPTRRHAERRDDRDALVGFHERHLRIEQVRDAD